MKSFLAPKTLSSAVLLHLFVAGVRLVFAVARWTNPRFRRAITSFEATYQFRAGPSTRRLVFRDGRVRTGRGACASPEYEVVFLDLPGALRIMISEPDNPLRLLTENKIEQSGNNYYLFKFGYLCGLCERQLHDLARSASTAGRNARSPGRPARPALQDAGRSGRGTSGRRRR